MDFAEKSGVSGLDRPGIGEYDGAVMIPKGREKP